ncbi:hypothetical protein VPH35_010567 [Triticum aestivum]
MVDDCHDPLKCHACLGNGHRAADCRLLSSAPFAMASRLPQDDHITPPSRRHPPHQRFPVTPHPFAPAPVPPYSPITPLNFGAPPSDSRSTDSDAPPCCCRPEQLDVYMPPVDMRDFERYGFAFVDPEATSPGPLVRSALLSQVPLGMEAQCAQGSHGTALVLFRSAASREFAVDESSFPVQEHNVYFERHEEDPNRLLFTHRGYAALALVGYPVEHWNRPHIHTSVGGMGNPMEISEICLSGGDYTAVLMVIKYERYLAIPQDLNVKNSDGLYAVVEVQRVRRWPIDGAAPPPPPPLGPPGGGGGRHGDGGGGPPTGGGGGPSCGLRRGVRSSWHHGSSSRATMPAVLLPASGSCAPHRCSLPDEAAYCIDVSGDVGVEPPPFSAITVGGIPRVEDMRIAVCDGAFHLLVEGHGGLGYFRVPQELVRASAHGPRGLAHVNLVSGAIGVIDNITVVKGVKKDVAVDLLADPVITGDPMVFSPVRLGGAGVMVDPVVPVVPPPPTHEASPCAAAAMTEAPPRVSPPRPKLARVQEGAPVRASARLRGKAPSLKKSILERAVMLKAAQRGDGPPVQPDAPPLFTTMEVKSAAGACDLPAAATDAILASFPVLPVRP